MNTTHYLSPLQKKEEETDVSMSLANKLPITESYKTPIVSKSLLWTHAKVLTTSIIWDFGTPKYSKTIRYWRVDIIFLKT